VFKPQLPQKKKRKSGIKKPGSVGRLTPVILATYKAEIRKITV
jgi:hypothetical protein